MSEAMLAYGSGKKIPGRKDQGAEHKTQDGDGTTCVKRTMSKMAKCNRITPNALKN